METKTTITKFKYRIEEKAGGGFIARADDSSMETLEGATREELQQKIEDKLTALVEDQIHKQFKLAGADVRVNVTRKVSTRLSAGNASPSVVTTSQAIDSSPRFENGGTFWRILALLVAIGAVVLYLLKR